MARRHEETVAEPSAKTQVGATFRQRDVADWLRLCIEDAYAVQRRVAHAPATPQVAVDIHPEPVRRARAGVDEHALVDDLLPPINHIQCNDLAGWLGTGCNDIQDGFVGGEGQPVRSLDIVRHHRRLAGLPVDPPHGGGNFGVSLLPLVIPADAERRVGEPDGAIGFHHHVIGGVQALALETVHQHRDAAVDLGAGDAPGAVLAGHQPPLAIAGVAVGVPRRLAEHADGPGFLLPFQDAVVGDVAPKQVSAIGDVDRALRPAAAGVQTLHGCERQAVLVEAGVQHLNGRVRVSLAWFPHGRIPRLVVCVRW